MTNWNMRTEELELKDGSTIKNYHYEFNSTDRVLAKIVEDVFKGIMDIKADHKTEPQTERRCGNCKFLTYRFNKTWCDIKCENPHDMVCDKWERSE